MTDADKRKRATKLANDIHGHWMTVSELEHILAEFAAELEAAAIERCEKVCIETWQKAENIRPEYRQTTISHGCKACADAIAKLREGK